MKEGWFKLLDMKTISRLKAKPKTFFISSIIALVTVFIRAPELNSYPEPKRFWVEVEAEDSFERSVLAEWGLAIEAVDDHKVGGFVSEDDLRQIQSRFTILRKQPLDEWSILQFPKGDEEYHDYFEVEDQLDNWVQEFPWDSEKVSLGKTVEGRDIWLFRFSEGLKRPGFVRRPGVLYVGGHHAREHLSVDVPLRFVRWFIDEYRRGNPRVVELARTREIHLVPMLNPDGLEYDIASGRYQMWRKNRKANPGGSFGVDLNRNYGYKWGGQGASSQPSSETYRGPQAFSEIETQAMRNYLQQNKSVIRIVLSFHSFSELILYPWGHTKDPIGNPQDRAVHERMAQTMSQWNGYKPMTSSGLYIASGDLTDWSYGELGMISFTFELDPKQTGFGGGGFYPGAKAIETALQKNIEPCLYLLAYADNPYRVLTQ
jgi:carboxypeptidase T